jgi:RHO1 GDP-GTP exchange protein 1/2
LTKRGGQGEDLQVYLFDHALVIVKQKSKHDQFKVIRRVRTCSRPLFQARLTFKQPIPLELLQISATDEFAPSTARSLGPKYQKSFRRNSLEKHKSTGPILVPSIKNEHRGFSIHFAHLGRKAYQITLWASTYVSQRKWVENIQKQQEVMRERSDIFESVTVSEGFFIGGNKANCAAPFSACPLFFDCHETMFSLFPCVDRARSVVYGTDDGVYLSDLRDPTRDPVKVLDLLDVSQVDVLEEYQLLIVLSGGSYRCFYLERCLTRTHDQNDKSLLSHWTP